MKTLEWTVDVFEKDEKATRLIRTLLDLTGLAEEDPCTVSELQAKGSTIRCTTCTGWVVMDVETAVGPYRDYKFHLSDRVSQIGHAHRHESMQIQLLPISSPEYVVSSKDAAKPPVPSSRFAFEYGNTELLLGPSRRARGPVEKGQLWL
ncbi:hypothetical protein JVU11DRAFT_5718 [Chiua virens]|nr:hypothetical protein JVU11DRAFT_5718 [Chiua virens]